jgi:hypothetical protein
MNQNETEAHDLGRAISEAAMADPALSGSAITGWYVISESRWPDGHQTLSIFRSTDINPWRGLGLIEFASLMERDRIAAQGSSLFGSESAED